MSESKNMGIEDVLWNEDSTYALGTYKYITWIIGIWPLQEEGIFAIIRFIVSFSLEFGILFSSLMEIILRCSDTDETLDFLALAFGTSTSLMKLFFIKLHKQNLRRILLSELKDWSEVVDNSIEKEIMWKYTNRGKLVCRIETILGCLVISSMILESFPVNSESYRSENVTWTNDNEFIQRTPLRTTCLFGRLSTSSYWIVFILQSVQLVNAIAVDMGNDVFFFGLAMHICSQLDKLKIFLNDIDKREDKKRVRMIDEFVERHSHVLDLAERLEDTYNNILLFLLIIDGLHICIAGIHILFLLKNNYASLVKIASAFMFVLLQLFLYSYAGEYLSTLSQEISLAIYDCPWYELSPKTSKHLIFIMMRAQNPLRLTAGRFYIMDIEHFKNIVKTSFSFFSVLRILFDE